MAEVKGRNPDERIVMTNYVPSYLFMGDREKQNE